MPFFEQVIEKDEAAEEAQAGAASNVPDGIGGGKIGTGQRRAVGPDLDRLTLPVHGGSQFLHIGGDASPEREKFMGEENHFLFHEADGTGEIMPNFGYSSSEEKKRPGLRCLASCREVRRLEE